jgi:hypothetical protein
MQAAALRRLVLVSIIVGLAGLLATLYTTVWAQPGQQGSVTVPGDQGPGIVWGYVYDDLNRNGVRNEGEPGIEGALVSFTSTSMIATTGTDGSYGFFDLALGDLLFVFDLPAGYVALPPSSVTVTVVDDQPIRVDFRASPLGVPEQPTSVVATAGELQATVTWVAPGNDGGSAITGYTITSSPASVTKDVGATTLTVTFTGLTGNTVYTFSVLATNAEGNGLPTVSNEVTVTAPVGTPVPPTNTPRPTLTPTPEPTGPTPTPSKPDVAVTAEPGGDVVVIDADVDTEQTSGDTIVTIKIDAGTVASARRVLVYSPTTVDDTKDDVPGLPAGTSYGTTIFRINLVEPDGTVTVGERLAKPIKLTVKYSDADLAAANNNPLNMRIFVYREGEGWVGLDTLVNIANKTLTTHVSRFSLFAILGAEPAVAPTAIPVNPTATFIPPSVGDVSLGSGMMMAFLALAVAFIATGAYYLRPRRKQQG